MRGLLVVGGWLVLALCPVSGQVAAPDEVRVAVEAGDAPGSPMLDAVVEQAYIKATNIDAGDFFGASVALSGDTLVVGATWEDSAATGIDGDQDDDSVSASGAVYVYVRSGATWSPQAYLKASNTGPGDQFGWSVSISGDTLLVGAPGEDSSAAGVDGDQSDNSEGNSGAVYVFVRDGSTWSQQAYLKASNPDGGITFLTGDEFGYSVSVSGDTAVVGAWVEASSASGVDGDQTDNSAKYAGAAYVFVRNGTTWSQQAYLKASNPYGGDPLDGSGNEFGCAVSISGDTLVVGSRKENSSATGVDGDPFARGAPWSGAAYVFVRNGTTWSQQAYLKASNTDSSDRFGHSLSLWGDTLVVGAWHEDSNATGVDGDQSDNSAAFAGAAYVFVRNGTTWSQQAYLKASNTDGIPLMTVGDKFATSVSLSGDTIAIGAVAEDSNATGVDGDQDDNSVDAAGAVYVFERTGSTWSQKAYLKAGSTDVEDEFGVAVAVSGDTVVGTSMREDSAATGVGGNPADNSASGAGAAYVFDLAFEAWADLGGGTVGSAGSPALVGGGSLVGGTPASVTLTNAPPSALLLAWVSFAPVPFAAAGGTVHAYPFSNQLMFAADGSGAFVGATVWPMGVPSGVGVWFQMLVQDGSVPAGFTLSNGLRGTTP